MTADLISALVQFDRLCGQFAALIQNSEPHIYSTLALILIGSFLAFPPKNDSGPF